MTITATIIEFKPSMDASQSRYVARLTGGELVDIMPCSWVRFPRHSRELKPGTAVKLSEVRTRQYKPRFWEQPRYGFFA